MELVGHQVGAYRILSPLGRGGTAEVYKAFHPALKREVAVKVILKEVSRDHDWVRRFRQEAELLGRLDHPHILPVYDAGEHDGRPYLVMKYMADGQTLRTQLSGQPWPLNRTVKVITQVAEALDAAHQAGVVHRDIKPSNILVTSELRCLVFDFGIAKPFRRDDNTTGSGLIVGTPEFMSPEQCKGDRIDHRSDVYSLGVMTYQMLTGHVPFSAETAVGILMKHLTEPLPIPPRGIALPPAVNGMLRKSMARDPRDRFTTAGEFGEALQQSANQRATVTLNAGEIRRAAVVPTLKLPAWVRKLQRQEVRLSLAGGVVALMLTVIYALWPSTAPAVGSASGPPQRATVASGADSDPGGAPSPSPSPPPPSEADAHSASQPDSGASQTSVSTSAPVSLGSLQIESNANAEVLLDGKLVGVAPGLFEAVEPGPRRVAVDAGQGRMQQRTVIVTPGSTHHLRFDFEEIPVDAARATARPHRDGGDSFSSDSTRARNFDARPPIREWSGWLTDADCGTTGGKQRALHLRCAERCIRAGQQPMLYSRGKLYRIDGFEHVTLVRGEPLTIRGWLELDTIHVIKPES